MISPYNLSDRYPIKKLGSIVTFLDNLRKPVTASDREEGDFPYYGANGQQGTINGYIFDEPLVLLAEDGGNFDDPTRSIAYIAKGKYWVNNHAHVLRPNQGMDLRYLYWVLAFYNVMPFIKGATRAKLTKTDACKIPVPFPLLETQKRIVELLDRAQALIDKRKEQIALMDQLIQSLFYDMFGDPVTNPKGWDVKEFGKYIESIIGGKSVGGEVRELVNGEFAVLKISAVTSGVFDPNEYKVVNESEVPEALIHPKKDDLLFSRANTKEMVGATCIVNKDCYNLFLPDKLWKIKLQKSHLSNWFVKFLLSHDGFRGNLRNVATGTSGSMLNISKAKLQKLVLIPIS